MKKTTMSNLTINSHSKADSNHDYGSINKAVGAGPKNPLDRSLNLTEEEEITALKKGGLLGENAEKYIMDSANLEGLPGDDDDDFEDEDEIDLDEELEIETDEVEAESIEIDDEDPDDIIEEDDDLDDDDDIL